MPATDPATIQGNQSPFGIELDEAGIVTQSIKVTNKRDKKELRDNCGDVVSVAHYNKVSEIEVTGVITSSFDKEIGDMVTFLNTQLKPEVASEQIVIDEISVDMSNEDFPKVTLKATAYDGIQ
jgi:hypothetical protein